jgi:hypothetical protein
MNQSSTHWSIFQIPPRRIIFYYYFCSFTWNVLCIICDRWVNESIACFRRARTTYCFLLVRTVLECTYNTYWTRNAMRKRYRSEIIMSAQEKSNCLSAHSNTNLYYNRCCKLQRNNQEATASHIKRRMRWRASLFIVLYYTGTFRLLERIESF